MKFKRLNLKGLIAREKIFLFLLSCIYVRKWMFTKFIMVIIHDVCKLNHYTVHLKCI